MTDSWRSDVQTVMLELGRISLRTAEAVQQLSDRLDQLATSVERQGQQIERQGQQIERQGQQIEWQGQQVERQGRQIQQQEYQVFALCDAVQSLTGQQARSTQTLEKLIQAIQHLNSLSPDRDAAIDPSDLSAPQATPPNGCPTTPPPTPLMPPALTWAEERSNSPRSRHGVSFITNHSSNQSTAIS